MTNQEILQIAMEQSAIDSGCLANDFRASENKIVISKKNINARKYLELPFDCDLTSYGSCIVASVAEELKEIVAEYIEKYSIAHCFETPNLLVLQKQIQRFDLDICFMAEYFLPDVTELKRLSCAYELKILTPAEFQDYYLPQWSNALCIQRKELDVLAVAAYDHEKMIGLAGCSADCDTMWQIGVDVLPSYRQQGVASALTSTLALEILKRGKVPFYCCAWSNIQSVRNAIKSGFKPAWVSMTAKRNEFISTMNR